jgi:hypothetical protein
MGNLEIKPESRKNVYKFVELKELIPKLKLLDNKDLQYKFPVCVNFYLYDWQKGIKAFMTNNERDSWEYPEKDILMYCDFAKLKLVDKINDTNDLPARVGLTREQYKMFFE